MSIKGQLDPAVKQRILKALRSGKYKFTGGKLFKKSIDKLDEDGDLIGHHCTLGAIYKEFGVKNYLLRGQANLYKHQLPENIRECIGDIFAEDGSRAGIYAMHINDRSSSYEEAANWIEKNL